MGRSNRVPLCVLMLMMPAFAGCGKEPASRDEVQGHVRAYQACAEAAKTKVELSNCAYAVGKM